jgi:NAD(P)H-quinone oxidoreductase subunit 5
MGVDSVGATPWLAPTILLAAAAANGLSQRWRRKPLAGLGEAGALAAFIAALLAAAFTYDRGGWMAWPLASEPAWGLRLDGVSSTLLLLVTFIGWIVTRFTRTYLAGDQRHGVFIAWLLATLALVTLLVTAGNLYQLSLSWIATSLGLHRLILFQQDRPRAIRAARKKFVFARLGDVALLGGCLLLIAAYGTAQIGPILQAARDGAGGGLAVMGAVFLATAALLKSAQFPSHGWLTEMMETPTPVSALLHAGIVNAGGFLLIRMADVIMLSPGVMAWLALTGGFTALFASAVLLTQSAAKTVLAWSTVAQMGFMILECGLGLFPLALLHIVAHSLYKAHAFLAAGEAVEQVRAQRRPGPVAVPGARAIIGAFALAMAIYLATGTAFGLWHHPVQSAALGAILVFGVAYLLAQGLAGQAPQGLAWRTSLYAVVVTIAYFALQALATEWTRDLLPTPRPPTALEWLILAITAASFGAVAIAQSAFPLWATHPAITGLRVHLLNGFYISALMDKALKSRRLNARGTP